MSEFLTFQSFSPARNNFYTPSTVETKDQTHKSANSPFRDLISESFEIRAKEMPMKPLSEASNFSVIAVALDEAIISDNPSTNYFFEKGCVSLAKKELLTAIKMFKKAISGEPSHYESWINLGICYAQSKSYFEAVSCFGEAISARKNEFLPYYNQALMFMALQDFSMALDSVEQCSKNVGLVPDDLKTLRTYIIFKSGKVTPVLSDLVEKPYFRHETSSNTRTTISKTPSPTMFNTRKHFQHAKKNAIFNVFPEIDKIRLVKEHRIKVKKHVFTPVAEKNRPVIQNFSPDFKKRKKIKSEIPKLEKKQSFQLNQFSKESNRKPIRKKEKSLDPGFFKSDVSLLNAKENILNDYQTIQRIKEEISKLKESVQKTIETETSRIIEDHPVINSALFTTETQLQYIISEYLKDPDSRDYKKIDKIFRFFAFFEKYEKLLRTSIYKISSVFEYHAGETVFKQGEIGEMLYLIIKGSINVIRESPEYGGYPIVINSLYDGKHFGDIALINDIKTHKSSQRTATCVASEHTFLLSIPKSQYQGLLLELHMQAIEAKTNFLIKVPLFFGISPELLVPLASIIDKKKFFLNEVILNKGEVPIGLYIIASGNVSLYTQGFFARNKHGSEYANVKIRKPKPDLFVGANFNGVRVKKMKSKSFFEEIQQQEFSALSIPEKKQIKRLLSKEKFDKIGKEMFLVKDEIPFAHLQPRDFFGGRAVLPSLQKKKESKFTVLAKSTNVEVFIITPSNLSTLNEKIVNQLRIIIEKSYEIDCPDDINPKAMDHLFVKWQQYKNEVVEEIRRNRYIERNKIQFPYMR